MMMNKINYILGKYIIGKRFRLWYYRKTKGICLWGLRLAIQDNAVGNYKYRESNITMNDLTNFFYEKL